MTSIQSSLVADCAALQRADDAIKHVLAQPRDVLTTSAKILLVAILQAEEGATQATLGARASLKPRQVGTLVKSLCDSGWIERQRRGGIGGGRLPDRYAYIGQTAKIAHCALPDGMSEIAHCPPQTAKTADCPKPQKLPIAPAKTPRRTSNAQFPTLDFGNETLTTVGNRSETEEITTKVVSAATRGSRISDRWQPCAKGVEFAAQHGFTGEALKTQRDEFVDYWIDVPGAKGVKADWLGTWRNHIRRQVNFRDRQGPAAKGNPSAPRRNTPFVYA